MPIAKNVPHGILGSEFVDRHLSNTPTQTHKYEHPNSSTQLLPQKAAPLQPVCNPFVAIL